MNDDMSTKPQHTTLAEPDRTQNKGFFEHFFNIAEIAGSKTLQLMYGVLLISFAISFYQWIGKGLTSPLGNSTCLPHISDCVAYKGLFPFISQPYGWSENVFYTFLFMIIIGTGIAAYQKKFLYAHFGLLLLFAWKAFIVFGISSGIGNFDYYDVVLAFIFLFSGNKLFFLRATFVLLYFLASTIKIHDGWITGTYFTSLQIGMPFFTGDMVPIMTNIVTILQIVACWFLLMPKTHLVFKFAFFEFLLFHFYSGTIVEYRYMLSAIPPLIILFGHADKVSYRHGKSIVGVLFMILLISLQSIAFFIPGDQKLTLEGNRYGLFMFEANHQCVAYATSTTSTGETVPWNSVSSASRNRCEPEAYLQRLQKGCYIANTKSKTVSFTLYHSINGGAFYKIVDEDDVCDLQYMPFKRNFWILSEQDNPEILGYPVKNFFSWPMHFNTEVAISDGQVILPGLSRNDPIVLSPLQELIRRHLLAIQFFYWFVWVCTSLVVIGIFLQRYSGKDRDSNLE